MNKDDNKKEAQEKQPEKAPETNKDNNPALQRRLPSKAVYVWLIIFALVGLFFVLKKCKILKFSIATRQPLKKCSFGDISRPLP